MAPLIRTATPDDAAEIVALVCRLAAFEGGVDALALTEDIVRRDGFGPGRRFEVLLAEERGDILGGVILLES